MTQIEERDDYLRIEKAIRFIEKHAPDQPSLEEVAGHINLSPYHFQKLFTRWAGVSPKRFLQSLTIQHAKRILTDSASVLDTALDVGLSGPSRLHDLFVSVDAVTPGEYKTAGKDLQISYGIHPTPFGDCLISTTERGICSLSFLDSDRTELELSNLYANWKNAEITEDQAATEEIINKIFYNRGEPLKILLKGTNFQLKVWQALLKIPEGNLMSYSSLANTINHPKSSRAVGNAVGQNPIGYLIPCHRVLRSTGEIGGYMWGTTRKRAIIAKEISGS